jgi:hypothetical protein
MLTEPGTMEGELLPLPLMFGPEELKSGRGALTGRRSCGSGRDQKIGKGLASLAGRPDRSVTAGVERRDRLPDRSWMTRIGRKVDFIGRS